MTDSNQYENLIARLLNDTISENEKKQLFSWINTSPENKKIFLDIKDTWDASRKVKVQIDVKLLEFYKKQAQSNRKISLWKTVGNIAAIIILGLLIGILVPQLQKESLLTENTFTVPFGSKSEVVLPDGSKVKLNSGSTLTYPANFKKTNRNVTLIGEAFFEVESDKENPFTVNTTDFEVIVTGTKFNVCSYSDDETKSATIVEGIVDIKFSDQQKTTRLNPGEKLTLNKKENKATILKADLEMETAWKAGEFIFKEIAFADLVKKLERWYDVKINYTDNRFNNYKYNGRFKNQETIWQVLDALRLTTPITYKRKGFREYEITFDPI